MHFLQIPTDSSREIHEESDGSRPIRQGKLPKCLPFLQTPLIRHRERPSPAQIQIASRYHRTSGKTNGRYEERRKQSEIREKQLLPQEIPRTNRQQFL